jgi:RNA polymerase sigma-32 factor
MSRTNVPINSGTQFDLRRCVPMSREVEHRCAVDYLQTKDPALAERLVVANMRLVVKLARQYCRAPDDLGDMVQEGNRGLLRAVEGYDPNRGIKFSTYAAWWIRAYILKFTIDNWRLVKVGTTQVERKLFFGLPKEQRRLEKTGGEANTHELASRLRVKETDVVAMLARLAGGEASLDAPVRSKQPGAQTVGDLLSDLSSLQPDRRVEDAEFDEVLRSKLKVFGDALRGRDADIFGQRLLTEDPITLSELAAKFGVTRERMRQVELRLKARIHDYLLDEMGDSLESLFDARAHQQRRGVVPAGRTIVLAAANSPVSRPKAHIVLEGLQT